MEVLFSSKNSPGATDETLTCVFVFVCVCVSLYACVWVFLCVCKIIITTASRALSLPISIVMKAQSIKTGRHDGERERESEGGREDDTAAGYTSFVDTY